MGGRRPSGAGALLARYPAGPGRRLGLAPLAAARIACVAAGAVAANVGSSGLSLIGRAPTGGSTGADDARGMRDGRLRSRSYRVWPPPDSASGVASPDAGARAMRCPSRTNPAAVPGGGAAAHVPDESPAARRCGSVGNAVVRFPPARRGLRRGSARSWGSGRLRPPCAHGLSLVVDIGVAERSVEGSDQLGSSGGSWIRSASPAAGFQDAGCIPTQSLAGVDEWR